MSQKKVDKYKEYKHNRKKINKKEKLLRRVEIGVAVAVVCVFIGWFAYSIYDKATRTDTEEVVATEWNVNAYMDYVSNLQTGYSSTYPSAE